MTISAITAGHIGALFTVQAVCDGPDVDRPGDWVPGSRDRLFFIGGHYTPNPK
jgi:hypothetical protein